MTCSPDEYDLGDLCCKKCPKGTRVVSKCNKTAETKCEPCPKGFYMNSANYGEKCLQCNSCRPSNHLQTSETCTNESDTRCMCMRGFYCTQTNNLKNSCENCVAVSLCQPGHGVSVPHNSTHDTVCTPCPEGTFNNKTDYFTTCQNHTRCSDVGRNLLSKGTAETDTKCGGLMRSDGCHWMLPAGLWAGLILTLILVFIGFLCLRCKKRRHAVITVESTQTFIPPALPPDVIKYPRSPELHTRTNNSKPCAEEYDGGLEYDGVIVLQEKCAAFSIPDTCISFISEPYRSEPQEDDWPAF